MKQFQVALLGFGTVGSGVYRIINENAFLKRALAGALFMGNKNGTTSLNYGFNNTRRLSG